MTWIAGTAAWALVVMIAAMAPRPTLAQVIDGRSPKGILYSFERVARGDDVAVAFAWRHGLDATTPADAALYYYGLDMLQVADGDNQDAFAKRLRELGATLSMTYPMTGYVGGSVRFKSGRLIEVADVLRKVIAEPAYPDAKLVDRYKRVMLPFREKQLRNPLLQLQAAHIEAAMPDYPGRRLWQPPGELDIKPPPRPRLIEWHKSTIGRDNLRVSAAGALSEGDAGFFIDRVFGGLPRTKVAAQVAEPVYRQLDKVIKIEREVPQAYVRMYGAVPWLRDPRMTAARILAVRAFGQGNGSLLYGSLREELGAAYSTEATYVSLTPGTALITATVQLDLEQAAVAVERMRRDYATMVDAGVDEATVRRLATAAAKSEDTPAPVLVRASSNLFTSLRGGVAGDLQSTRAQMRNAVAATLNPLIRESMPKGLLTIVMAPASVAIKADCTVKAVSEITSCGF